MKITGDKTGTHCVLYMVEVKFDVRQNSEARENSNMGQDTNGPIGIDRGQETKLAMDDVAMDIKRNSDKIQN